MTYHALAEGSQVLAVSPRLFQAQMQFLAEAGFEVLRLEEVVQRVRAGQSFAPRSVALTFDDGLQSLHREGLPVLRSYGWAATVFAVTNYCGRSNAWPGQPNNIPPLPLLNWHELGELAGSGFEIGAHTANHALLTGLEEPAVETELVNCQEHIRQHLGISPQVLAYPYGDYNETVLRLTRQHFAGAVTTHLREASSASDPYRLERLDMYYLRDMSLFRQLGTPWLRAYLAARRGLRGLKRKLHG